MNDDGVNSPLCDGRVAIIGGGVSGLTAAWRLAQSGRRPIDVLESGDRVGGVLQTQNHGHYLVERSADMFTSKDPWALDLCRELGLEDQLVGADESRRRAYVVCNGALHQVPQGFVLMRPTQLASMATTPLLTVRGKLRLMCEPFIPPRKEEGDESLQSFVTRRLGREVFERIVQPLVGGIYTADPEKLSMQAAMPAFVEMERKFDSLIKAPPGKGEAEASGARYGAFVAPRTGMQAITDALKCELDRRDHVRIRYNTPVRSVTREESGWRIETSNGFESYRAVILATPAYVASSLLQGVSTELADQLAGIPYASAAVAIFGCAIDDIARPVDGFGFVVPMIEQRKILAVSFGSHKFPGRAPEGRVLIRVFLGGACQEEILEHDDDELQAIALSELRELIGYDGAPDLRLLVRWNRAMPQYHLGHLDRVDRIETLLDDLPGLTLAGNSLRGVGVPFCIRSGNRAAQEITEFRN